MVLAIEADGASYRESRQRPGPGPAARRAPAAARLELPPAVVHELVPRSRRRGRARPGGVRAGHLRDSGARARPDSGARADSGAPSPPRLPPSRRAATAGRLAPMGRLASAGRLAQAGPPVRIRSPRPSSPGRGCPALAAGRPELPPPPCSSVAGGGGRAARRTAPAAEDRQLTGPSPPCAGPAGLRRLRPSLPATGTPATGTGAAERLSGWSRPAWRAGPPRPRRYPQATCEFRTGAIGDRKPNSCPISGRNLAIWSHGRAS